MDLTQEELAAAIKVSSRTIQNWESGVGLSQLEKRASDLAELSDLLNDYLPRDQQAEWLRSSNEAFGDRAPIELLTAGRLRDLTIEFRRVQAGQPM